MKRIAVLTSGGDAAGMNAAIRAVVRTGIHLGLEVMGVQCGYAGLIAGNWRPLSARDVGGILPVGGTMLGSSRCLEFTTEQGPRAAIAQLEQAKIDGLLVIGGNGSQTGAFALSQLGFPVVGVASTIDNDLYGSDITIGVDTALNIALESIDRLRSTATAHHRAFLVEVMGRNCGYLALMSAIAGGAEAVCLPEYEIDPEQLAAELADAYDRGKSHAIVVVAEGASLNATGLMQHFQEHRERLGFDVRATILGHVQRGGNPGAFDRILASRLGAAATEEIASGNHGLLVGLIENQITITPLPDVVANEKSIDPRLYALAQILAK
ncbi:ATP-dependent 6-phosphofructokinase [Lignipirellula cremea]|uniref:ATP-dependent 6-phosphofructokinase n=1 Tax=Lignipirellula cremea TaxID=2528010 RepID=A0A518E483_9BACT|nr:ATP-dependent 6-phosphofructokinase [Lignipirellula cremea]QDU98883.1 6-phosphofructokinase [Lignipirellula cremea]